jgi:hypothetical protein
MTKAGLGAAVAQRHWPLHQTAFQALTVLAVVMAPRWLPIAHSAGHLLIVGTTGAGKTRLLDLLVNQAVRRGAAVVILDPKGKGGRRHWRPCCGRLSRGSSSASPHFVPRRQPRQIFLQAFERDIHRSGHVALCVITPISKVPNPRRWPPWPPWPTGSPGVSGC